MIIAYIIMTVIGFIITFRVKQVGLANISKTEDWSKLYFITPAAIRSILILLPAFFARTYIDEYIIFIVIMGNGLLDYLRVKYKLPIIISQMMQILFNYLIFILLET